MKTRLPSLCILLGYSSGAMAALSLDMLLCRLLVVSASLSGFHSLALCCYYDRRDVRPGAANTFLFRSVPFIVVAVVALICLIIPVGPNQVGFDPQMAYQCDPDGQGRGSSTVRCSQ